MLTRLTGNRRQLLALGALAAVLVWLFIKAGAVSPAEHYRYLRDLRNLGQADIEVNAGVLALHAELRLNYDGLIAHVQRSRDELDTVARIPAFVDPETRVGLLAQVAELKATILAKAAMVDRFQRANSVWRNSVDYFPRTAEVFLNQTAASRLQATYGRFIRGMLVLSRTTDPELVTGLQKQMSDLAQTSVPDAERAALDHLMLHAGIIIARHPELDRLVREIGAASTTKHLESLTQLYTAGHERSQRVATGYRLLLVALALALLIYAAQAYLRHESDRLELVTAHRELNERFEAQRLAEERMRLYANVFSHAHEGMTITDPAGHILAVNPAFCAITGYAAEEVIGHTPALLRSGRQDAYFYEQMWSALRDVGVWSGEIWNRRKNGEIYPEWLSITAIRDEQGRHTHYIAIFADVTERKEVEQRIHFLANHDALTGLPNRLLLEDRIEQAVLKSRRRNKTAAVLFLDLDRFKNINDTLGHNVGDQLLVEAAIRATDALRETDTLSRQGGDEFVAVLTELDSPQDAAHVARKLLQVVGAPYHLAGHELVVTGSIGIALFPDDGETVSDLLRNADTAMYRAKEEGRNAFRYYDAGMNFATLGELLLESHLRSALDRGELLLYYQPKVDAISGHLVAAEALMRWQHPEQGLIPPGRFIPLAEECGLIGALGAWAINAASRQQRAWLDAGLQAVPVAVNVSAQQFSQEDVPRLVAAALKEHRLTPDLIDLELTESLLMRNAKQAGEVLQRLRAMQISVALDDFGTGYSSLSYLEQFPVQALKIDQSFVQAINPDGGEAKLIAAIIALAHSMGMYVIAEGVETDAQRHLLVRHGCDQCQGYLFAKPLPAEQFVAWLERRKQPPSPS
jgi:diguanylate cyclase (GGDEF)-like protein/PAS domain S-box-containing protein